MDRRHTQRRRFRVHSGRNKYRLIPYAGNKAGFAHIFEKLMPPKVQDTQIIDVFGGGGAFTIYCCFEFGSKNVTYNDNNPTLTNFVTHVRDNPINLVQEYNKHRVQSSINHYMGVRDMPLDDGVVGAGRFLYLAKNAFSGKIRFNKSNKFNTPMRKGAQCPTIRMDHILQISNVIKRIKITDRSFEHFADTKNAFLYLDPPSMNGPSGNYKVPFTENFVEFVHQITPHNNIMISERNEPAKIGIPDVYSVYDVVLKRPRQYRTQANSKEVIAINYEPKKDADV